MTAVAELWRYPVKSMGGHRVASLRLDRRGAHADRLWAVRDVEQDVTVSARTMPALLRCTARYVDEPADDAGPGRVPPVVVTFPDGREVTSDDPAVHDAVSEVAGRPVRLVPLESGRGQHRLSPRQMAAALSMSTWTRALGIDRDEALPDLRDMAARDMLVLTRFATPPGAFHDLSPVHLLTCTSLATIAAATPGSDVDVRRFRPTVLLADDAPGGTLPEAGWTGDRLELGAATVRVSMPTVRCVVPSRAQPGLAVDRGISRALTREAGRFLGVYGDVVGDGVVHEGDEVRRHVTAPPGPVRRYARRGLAVGARSVLSGVRRLEETISRPRS
ncbi:MOSC domain-containing protein [Jatrophihabitans fulvus]